MVKPRKYNHKWIKELLLKYRNYDKVAKIVDLPKKVLFGLNHNYFRIEMDRTWSQKDIDFLLANYFKYTNRELGELLVPPRSGGAVSFEARQLGLKKTIQEKVKSTKQRLNSPWTKEKVELLKKCFANKSDEEVAKELSITKKQLQSKARRLGLKKSSKHMEQVFKELSKNIASGPYRHNGVLPGSDHPSWIEDRTKLRGPRKRRYYFSKSTQKQARQQSKCICAYCEKQFKEKEINYDHVKPVFIEGSPNLSNCQILCKSCHFRKTLLERKASDNYKNKVKLINFFETYSNKEIKSLVNNSKYLEQSLTLLRG